MSLFMIISILLVGTIIGFMIGYVLAKKNNHYKIMLENLTQEYDILNQEIQKKNLHINELSQNLASKQTLSDYLASDCEQLKTQKNDNDNHIAILRDKITNLEAQKNFYEHQRTLDMSEIDGLKKHIECVISEKQKIETLKADIELQLNSVSHKNDHLQIRLAEQHQEFIRLQKTSEQTFENLAHKIFNEKSQAFTQKSEKTLNDILSPVKESLGLFQTLVTDKFSHQDKQQYALQEELKRIIDINEKMTFQADSLTKALKGDNKIMGNWGEMLLERILEDSGLTKNIDYVLQASGYDLKDDSGKRQIPDVIVKLPESKEVIIDAKVSLLDYERIIANPDERIIHEKAFLKSVKSHIDGLASKKYFQNEKLLSPDFVLMFLPIEGAYNLAMQIDNQLHHYAWNKRIAIVSNTTLFATLRTVASLWRIEKQNKNAEEIAKRAGLLYEKFAGFMTDIEAVSKKFDDTHKLFDDTKNKLYQGKGNLITQVESLKELGAKTSKSLPTNSTKEYLKEIELESVAETI